MPTKLHGWSLSPLQRPSKINANAKQQLITLNPLLRIEFNFSIQDEKLGFPLLWWLVHFHMASPSGIIWLFASCLELGLLISQSTGTRQNTVGHPISARFHLNRERWAWGNLPGSSFVEFVDPYFPYKLTSRFSAKFYSLWFKLFCFQGQETWQLAESTIFSVVGICYLSV